jgi:type II secretory pathway pseudopilin PulG
MAFKQHKILAFTLIEVVTAVLVITIVIAGAAFIFAMGRGQIARQKHYRAATQLAAQKLEQLKVADYNSVVTSGPEDINNLDIDYTRNTHVNNDPNATYKVVRVTVSWEQGNDEPNVSLVTCIAP